MVFPIETHFRFLFFAILRSVCNVIRWIYYLLEILLVLLILQESEMQLGKTFRSFPLYWFFKLGSDYAFRLFLCSNLQFMYILFKESHVIAFRLQEEDLLLFDLCFDCTFT